MAMKKLIVLYDGSCPTCIRDRQWYEKLIGKINSHIVWCDFNCHQELLDKFSISRFAAMTELHLIINNERVIKSIDAYVLLLNQIFYLKPIAWLMTIPFIYNQLESYYLQRVQQRLKKTGRL